MVVENIKEKKLRELMELMEVTIDRNQLPKRIINKLKLGVLKKEEYIRCYSLIKCCNIFYILFSSLSFHLLKIYKLQQRTATQISII